jgi:hypothetical protein
MVKELGASGSATIDRQGQHKHEGQVLQLSVNTQPHACLHCEYDWLRLDDCGEMVSSKHLISGATIASPMQGTGVIS